MNNYFSSFILLITVLFSCSESDTYEKIMPPVVVDLSQVPYLKLSDYHFFREDLKNLLPNERVLPYKPATELFTDYASKSRFVWLPENTKANLTHPNEVVDLPIGSVLIKNFYYENLLPNNHRRVIETRLFINTHEGWQPFTYVWNTEQTEAFLSENKQVVPLNWKKTPAETLQINYVIPAKTTCYDCHHQAFDSDELTPIGIKPYHLNHIYQYNDGLKNQWVKWQEVGILNPHSLALSEATVDFSNNNEDMSLRVRSYLDINCAHCHRIDGYAGLLPIKFSFHLTQNNQGLGVCDNRILPAENPGFFGQHYVLPGQPDLSLIYHKMLINTNGLLMPPVGRTINHDEALVLMNQWMMSLTDCE